MAYSSSKEIKSPHPSTLLQKLSERFWKERDLRVPRTQAHVSPFLHTVRLHQADSPISDSGRGLFRSYHENETKKKIRNERASEQARYCVNNCR